ncbi:MAG: sodium/solute symporter [Verrucomicrobiae bacterium]|nr:sodium/solute symporter [Verrucomicrobiae bacterium]
MGVYTHFKTLDWVVLVGYLLLTTWIGHALRGKQSTIRDFFLAGRSLPWQAVCGSIIATEISALTFIGVPGMVFAAGGDWTYLQWAIGSVIARFIVGIYFAKAFFEREIYSPYDYMQNRLGGKTRSLTTTLFFLGSILGQSVRLLVTAIVLKTVTGLDFHLCILIIGLFAIVWTWMGGMTTVIWTDVVQFGVFVFSGLLALGWIVHALPGGVSQWIDVASTAGKFRLIDLTRDPSVGFTLWVGILAMPFQNMAAFGTDQLNAQRMFCCRSARDAGKAMIFSSLGQFVTILMLCVGTALFAYYQHFSPSPEEISLFGSDADYVFPVWITTVLPAGITGLILAGAFAAAISSLDSALAALSQATLALRFDGKDWAHEGSAFRMLLASRIAVVFWGITLPICAIGLDHVRGNINLVNLAFGMVSYTYGPMLGIFLLAMFRKNTGTRGVWIGLIVSIGLTLYVRPDVYTVLKNFTIITPEQALEWQPKLHYAWLYPITCLLTLGCGLLFSSHVEPNILEEKLADGVSS